MDSTEWDVRYAQAPGLVWTATPNRFVVEEVADLPAGTALDLAAGEGRNAVWLAERGWRVTAVDFSAVATDRGRELSRQRGVQVDWQVADVTTYRPAAGYDLVLIAYLHLPDPTMAQVLSAAREAVRPGGGRLVVVGHDLANLTGGTGGPQAPEVLWTPERAVTHLPGWDIRRADTARRPVPVDDGSGDGRTVDALDTVVVAVRP